jgi:hypothetical protein
MFRPISVLTCEYLLLFVYIEHNGMNHLKILDSSLEVHCCIRLLNLVGWSVSL